MSASELDIISNRDTRLIYKSKYLKAQRWALPRRKLQKKDTREVQIPVSADTDTVKLVTSRWSEYGF